MEQCNEISSSDTETETPITGEDYAYMKTLQPYLSDEVNAIMPSILWHYTSGRGETQENQNNTFQNGTTSPSQNTEFANPISSASKTVTGIDDSLLKEEEDGVSSTTSSSSTSITSGLIKCVNATAGNDKLKKNGRYSFNLQFDIDHKAPSKSCNYTYSKLLDKFFVQMDKMVPLKFTCDIALPADGVEIRSYLVFKEMSQRDRVVDRCPHHLSRQEVLSCHHVMDTMDDGCDHVICPATKRYVTVLKPGKTLTKRNINSFISHVRFRCASACRGGIDRHPILALFELYVFGKFEGRAVVEVSICSSPGRDRENGEKKKRRAETEFYQPAEEKKSVSSAKRMCCCENGFNSYGGQYLIGVNSLENAIILRQIAEKMNRLDDLENNSSQANKIALSTTTDWYEQR